MIVIALDIFEVVEAALVRNNKYIIEYLFTNPMKLTK